MSKNLNSSYLKLFKEVGQYKLLDKDEEIELAQKIEKGDKKARDLMINSNLRLAIKMAKKFSNNEVEFEDLLQESFIGLIKAVDRYDWRKGHKFSTYAFYWIRVALQTHIAKLAGTIKMPNYYKLLIFKMHKFTKEYNDEFGFNPTPEEIGEALGVTPNTLQSLLDCARQPIRLDSEVNNNGDDSGSRELHNVISNEDNLFYSEFESPDAKIDREKLTDVIREALSSLSEREELIIRLRFGISEEDYAEFKNCGV